MAPSAEGSSSLVLYQFRPAYDVLAYLAFAGLPLVKCQVENLSHPTLRACAAQPLPCLRSGNRFIPSGNIIHHIKQEYADLDAGMGLETRAESHAFASMLQVELQYCLDVVRFADEEHWWSSTYPELVRTLPAPFGRLVARQMRREALQRIHGSVHSGNSQGKQLVRLAVQRAQACYQALSDRLGDNKWLLNTAGGGASTVDALLFGHLCQARAEPLLACVLLPRAEEEAEEEEDEDAQVGFPNLDQHYRQTLNRLRQSRFFSASKPLFRGPDLELVVLPPASLYPALLVDKKQKQSSTQQQQQQQPEADEPPLPSAWDKSQTGGLVQAALFAIGTVVAYMAWNELIIVREAEGGEGYE